MAETISGSGQRGLHTWQEISSQPEVWRITLASFDGMAEELAQLLQRAAVDAVLAIGCGSTHYLAQTGAGLISRLAGLPSRAVPSSELWLFPDAVRADGSLLVAISRSGATTETTQAVDRFRSTEHRPVVVATCYEDSPLAAQGDFVLLASAAKEQSVAQTRSFTSLLLLIQAFAALLGGRPGMLDRLQHLPSALEDVLDRTADLARHVGSDPNIEQLFFLGSGPLYGLANEAMLKVKEMSLSQAEAYHFLEFRHGPMSMIDEHTLVVGLVSDTACAHEIQLLEEMQELGARTLAIVEDGSRLGKWQPTYLVELRSRLGEWERTSLYLPFLQHVAYHRAMTKGLDPDRPRHLRTVVDL